MRMGTCAAGDIESERIDVRWKCFGKKKIEIEAHAEWKKSKAPSFFLQRQRSRPTASCSGVVDTVEL